MIRAVVFDLDGTLLDENREISALNRRVIRDLRAQGIKVFLASGRTYMSMLPYYQSLDLDTPIISYNGAKIIYPDGEISESKLESQAVNTLVELSRSFQVHLNLYHDETWYTERAQSTEAIFYAKTAGLTPVALTLDRLTEGATKALFIAEPEKLSEVKVAVVERLGDQVAVTSSIRTFLEVLKRGVNKGQALQHVMRRYEIDLRDVVAFGDGLNDLEMLQEVGLGVAMENAYQELKVAADDIAPHHQRGGVGLYLQRLLDRLNQG